VLETQVFIYVNSTLCNDKSLLPHYQLRTCHLCLPDSFGIYCHLANLLSYYVMWLSRSRSGCLIFILELIKAAAGSSVKTAWSWALAILDLKKMRSLWLGCDGGKHSDFIVCVLIAKIKRECWKITKLSPESGAYDSIVFKYMFYSILKFFSKYDFQG
jgi:hypothetical protein